MACIIRLLRAMPDPLRLMRRGRFVAAALCMVTFAWVDSADARRPYYEEERPARRIFFRGPAQDNPTDQFAYAQSLHERGRLRRAGRHYRLLVRHWPAANEAPDAQLAYARVLEERGRLARAVDELDRLAELYVGQFPHEVALQKKFAIAERMIEERRGQWFIFPGFNASERAIPVLESIVRMGPRWERSPQAQLMIGQIQEENGHREEAVLAFERVETRYPRSPEAEEAAFARARVLMDLADRYPRDQDTLDAAFTTLALILQQFPEAENAETAASHLRDLHERRASMVYNRALFYDRIARRPMAAEIVYERLLANFPDSELAASARARLDELQKERRNKDATI